MSNRTARRPILVDKQRAYELAKDTWTILEEWIRSNIRPDEMDGPVWTSRRWSRLQKLTVGNYITTSVDGRDFRVPVFLEIPNSNITWGGPRKWVGGGNVRSLSYGGKNARPISLTVEVDASNSPDDLLRHKDQVIHELISVLIHEMTHVRDTLAVGKPVDSMGRKETEYYNLPHEVRAFMQQIVHEIEPQFRVALRSEKRTLKEDPEWGISGIIALKSMDSVEKFLERSATWNRVRRFVNPKNRKILLQAVARRVDDLWDEYARPLIKDPVASPYRLPDRVAKVVAREWIQRNS